MPAQSLIIGVDLAPIKPIPRAITFQSDITTEKCRATIRGHLKHWKADTVLHDGAPNVGTAWVQDAFSQAELVLQSLKLATEFLAEGGNFVTKVFRSKDYNPLLWVFKQLFTSVEATKPPSSRNVSAEIFVVCRGFKAPKRLDPKFLDPKHVFAELSAPTPNNEAKVFNPEKKKRKREGYEEGDWTQFKEIPVSEFINTTDPIAILGQYNKLSFVEPPGGDLALSTVNRLEETTDEIKTCCEDLKILGKKEFRNLLRWRLKVREKFGLVVKKKQGQEQEESEEVAEIAPMDEELAIQEQLLKMREKESTRDKKERRKENEKKRKEIVRMQMHMTTPMDIGMEQHGPGGEDTTFSLKRVDRANARDAVVNARDLPAESDDESESESESEDDDEDGDRLERELDSMYEHYQERMEDRDSKLRAKKARKEYESEAWEGFSDENKSDDEDEEDEDSKTAVSAVRAPQSGSLSNNAAMFFDQDIFQGVDEDEEEDEDDDEEEEEDEDEDEEEDSDIEMDEEEVPAPTPKQKNKKENKKEAKKQESEWVDSDEEPEEQDPRKPNGQLGKFHSTVNDYEGYSNINADIDIITAEAMALAQQMASGEKKTSDVVDDGWNRYSFRDVDGMPDWFMDDENQHSKIQRPITKAAAAAIKEKMRAINARPIKKVMEAKGRKKFKAAQKLEKLRKKSALLADDEALSERDKSQAITKLMSKATKKKPKQQVKLVVARGANRGISGRPKGVKGKYKIVDSRMKKDIRAQKRLAKKKKA